ncbi:MAG: ABC transporter ATP-binding protein [Burkholderiaceae bacterium]|nr:ABC transporter ATP-binding protein [Burkholderiaceae bacterium]MEB2319597.1 ABC transporter ATP-binding protein [Pseudomonadota bacterium]
MNDPAVTASQPRLAERKHLMSVKGLGKRYSMYESPGHRLLSTLLGPLVRRPREYVALEGIEFDIEPGDALAVIGRNGAGKSTLLQLLSGVLEPSTGSIDAPARIAGLLELGSGFNPDFTGRENVFINAAILGLSRRQIEERLDDIVSFAEIGEFVDMPVKTYSSGMFLRLAFSVAIAVEPELLLVDEALTVGDVFFQQKCYARLDELRRNGMSVLLVTHSMADAAEFCNKGIVLSQGRIVFSGSGREAVEYYFHHERETPTGRSGRVAPAAPPDPDHHPAPDTESPRLGWPAGDGTIDLGARNQHGQGRVIALRAVLTDADDRPCRVFEQGESMRVHVDYRFEEDVEVPLVGMSLINAKGWMVHGRNSLQFDDTDIRRIEAGSVLRVSQQVDLLIETGEYTIEIGAAELPASLFDNRKRYTPAEISPHVRLLCHVNAAAAFSVVNRRYGNPCLFSHYGVADLPGNQSLAIVDDTQR